MQNFKDQDLKFGRWGIKIKQEYSIKAKISKTIFCEWCISLMTFISFVVIFNSFNTIIFVLMLDLMQMF